MPADVVVRRARALMAGAGLDAIVAASPQSVAYTSGARGVSSTSLPLRLALTVLPREAPPVLIVCNLRLAAAAGSWIRDVRPYVEFAESPMERLVHVLTELGLPEGRIGVELTHLQAHYYRELTALAPRASIVGCDDILERMRAIKTPAEIALLERAAIALEKAIRSGFEGARPDEPVRALATSVAHAFLESGGSFSRPAVQVGHRPGVDRLAAGELFFVEYGGVHGGYQSDLARMASVGEPSPHQKEVFAAVTEVRRKLLRRMRPGVRAAEIYESWREEYLRLGLPARMPHIGHGLGLSGHEHPILQPRDEGVLEPDMVLCLEPGLFMEEEPYHVEDTVLITEGEPRILSSHTSSEELFIIR